MPDILKTLCRNTYTTADIHRRIGLLHTCLEEVLFHQDTDPSLSTKARCVAHAERIASPVEVEALSAWDESVFTFFSQQNLSAQIQVLKEQTETLPRFVMYVPVQFDEKALAHVGQWCRTQMSPLLLLDLHVDPNVTGGCAFVSNDTYIDLSLHRSLSAQKGIVAELLSSYE